MKKTTIVEQKPVKQKKAKTVKTVIPTVLPPKLTFKMIVNFTILKFIVIEVKINELNKKYIVTLFNYCFNI
jgi:hypothetical protein